MGLSSLGVSDRASAMVEAALVMPVFLLLIFGMLGASRVISAQMAVSAVSREAARAGALASTATAASGAGLARGKEVAGGYGLDNGSLVLSVDPGTFQRGGTVTSEARYTVQLTDLPLLHWTQITVSQRHAEPVDLYRSRWGAGATS